MEKNRGTFMVRRREDIVFSGRWPEPGVDGLDMGVRLGNTMKFNKSERGGVNFLKLWIKFHDKARGPIARGCSQARQDPSG